MGFGSLHDARARTFHPCAPKIALHDERAKAKVELHGQKEGETLSPSASPTDPTRSGSGEGA